MDPRIPLQPSDDMTPTDFAALPKDEQKRILLWGGQIADEVVGYAVKILVGPSLAVDPNATINHASGVILRLNSRYVLATADHVIRGFEEKYAANEAIIFQAGNARLHPKQSAVYRDKDADISLLALSLDQLSLIPAKVYDARSDWPPVLPESHIWLTLVGFPVEFRRRPTPEVIELNALGALMRVTSRGVGNLKCTFEREVLVPVYGGYVPPPETEFGGMSGGPAFYMEGDRPILAGLITDHNGNLDTFWIGRLDTVPEDITGSHSHTAPP